MARKSWNDDYIPNEADYEAKKESMQAWQSSHADPRHTYRMKYVVDGAELIEKVFAISEDEAIEQVHSQWGMVGKVPQHVMAERLLDEEGQS